MRISSVLSVLSVVIVLMSCNREPKISTGGDPARGKQAIDKYGCNACHAIPGIDGPKGMVGPNLDHFAARAYIAGKIPNNPDTLIKWLQNPPGFDPNTTMPNMGITEPESRDIAAYLYTLK